VASTEGSPARSPITTRAVGVGLFFSVLINLVMGYNDWYLHNTLLIGNHFPYIAIAILMVLILGVNVGLRRVLGIAGFTAGELVLIWAMIGIAGGIGSAGLMRYWPSYMAAPAYYATGGNEYGTYILKFLPDWMVVSRDPNSRAVRWFMEGLSRGGTIPWVEWLVPMGMWFGFMGCLYATNFSLVSIFFHQWSVRERLIFPVVSVPAMMAEEAPAGSLLNAFFRNRLTWIGIGIPIAIWGWNGLKSYFPQLPLLPMNWYSWELFPDRPWSELHLEDINIYFTVIGLSFLLTTEIAFSFWFFYILYRASFVWVAWLGAGATGFWGNWWRSVTVFETAGCILVITGFLFWAARRALREWWGRAVAGRSDPEADAMAPRLALVVLAVGFAGMVGWFLLAGAQWWAALIGVVMFVSVLLVLTRVVAESGLIFVQSNVIPYDLVAGLFPPAWLSGFTLASLTMQKCVHMFDLREIFMPYLANGVRAANQARISLGKVLIVFAVTAVVAVGASAFGKIVTSYKYGGVNLDLGANITFPASFLGSLADYQKNPPNFEFVKIGDRNVFPVNLAHMIVGGALTAGMLVLRATFLWWPIHPFGLVMCGTWAMTMFWFSFFIGWIAKIFFMTFLGASTYRRFVPLFLGLAVGESLIAAFWAILGLVTGTPGISVLPY
jgi:hypothetical protein